jgi:lysophospholipase L1-like esterase
VENATTVRSTAELVGAVAAAKPGDVIALADGEYRLERTLQLNAPRMTLRSVSGHAGRVVIDAAGCSTGEGIQVRADDVTLAEFTLRNARFNGIKLEPHVGGHRFTAYGCVLHNIWQRGIKCPLVPAGQPDKHPRDGRIVHCLFVNDHAKRFEDDETDTPQTFNGNYVGGIDLKTIAGWAISDNVFLGIQGRTREARAAVYLADQIDRTIVERNVVIDGDIGIAIGNPSRGGDWDHCTGCIVRNNLVARCPETGILAVYTRDCLIVHNTVLEPNSRYGRLIWAQLANHNLLCGSNLLVGKPARLEGTGNVRDLFNVADERFAALLVDPATGDLRLGRDSPELHGPADAPPLATSDFEQMPRALLVAGADQLGSSAKNEPKQVAESADAWVPAMRKVHERFRGTPGAVAQLGDSITHSMAFWSALGWSDPTGPLTDDGLPKTPSGKRWQDVILGVRDKGPEHGNYSGWRVGNLLEVVDGVLARKKPEVALVMIGTNDISGGKLPKSYEADLKKLLTKLIDAGCVPIVNTIPPRVDHDSAVKAANDVIRTVATELKLPLVDYHAAILERRPGNAWQGTLISNDGVHPTANKTHDFSPENLKSDGYALRNWLNFCAYREVYFRVLHPVKATIP